jgi:diketogulonate reductase-like aldo/keto reductase
MAIFKECLTSHWSKGVPHNTFLGNIVTRLSIENNIKLNNGVLIPVLGLGVYQTRSGRETHDAALHALRMGYRHFDTAKFYRNEKDVATAVRESGISREQIFITTKLWNDDQGYDKTIRACHESLKRMELPYIDLYLIHYPVRKIRMDSWRAMETLYEEGKCRAIGVSNYTERHIEELLQSSKIVPAVNQVEFHPYLYQKELLDFCHKNQIHVEAYSPLTKGKKLNDPKLATIAARYKKSSAQLLIRWALQHGLIVLPKSSHAERIRENADVFDFEISSDDMESLNNLHRNYRVAWDPSNEP